MASDQPADAVVTAALDAYSRLPKHGKPVVRDNGVREWTVFASIIVTTPSPVVASIGTGVKCLPANRLPPLGDTIHDSHAEVLARRGFVHYLLSEATSALENESDILSFVQGKFVIKDNVETWLYISALPCGDASTLHTAAHQDDAAASSYKGGLEEVLSAVEGAARGRSGYANLGAIRTKPGRRDAPASISFSCSDKIALWCALGLQGGLLECFAPVYLDHIVVGGVIPTSQGEGWRETIRHEVERAVYGRLEGVVHLTNLVFPFDKPEGDCATANTSLSFVEGYKPEVLVNGGSVEEGVSYASLKARNVSYATAKRVLRGELGVPVGAEWNLPHEFRATAGDAPFTGWIVAGDRYTSFTAAGERRE
ncbi:hypothetical protein CspHIS471_0410900 [Cutaneotrichosporon sp. HIS471]|nr:hypothetical protein CspHIS471_0410900 [Cutaneotrichosporon sp. HIS471]